MTTTNDETGRSQKARALLTKCQFILKATKAEERARRLRESAPGLLAQAQALLGVDAVALYRAEGSRLVLESHVGYTKADGAALSESELRESLSYELTAEGAFGQGQYDGITGYVGSRGIPFIADSAAQARGHFAYRGKPEKLGVFGDARPLHNLLVLPLQHDGRTVGVLRADNKRAAARAMPFDARDLGALESFARFMAVAIAEASNDAAPPAAPAGAALALAAPPRLDELAKTFDGSNMARVIEQVPAQIEFAAADPSLDWKPKRPLRRAIVAGMGGSALPVEIVVDAFFPTEATPPVSAWRRYELPSFDDETLVVVSSFSGNTEETLSVLRALPDSANAVAITAGGKLEKEARERGFPVVKIPAEREPQGFQPRSATGYFVSYLVRFLEAAGVLRGAVEQLAALPAFLKTLQGARADAEELARWLEDRIPVIYTDEAYLGSVARITKIKLNENSKRPAFFNALPESNHNELIGFASPYGAMGFGAPYGRFGFLYLRDPQSHARVHRRFDVMRDIFGSREFGHIDLRQWDIPGTTRLEKIFAALTLADWLSYALGLLACADPTPVELVEHFKGALGPFED